MDGHTFFMHTMQYCVAVLVVLPGSVDGAQPANGQLNTLPIGFHTTFTNANLAGSIQTHQLVVTISMTMLQTHNGRRLFAHRVQTCEDEMKNENGPFCR